MRTWLPTSGARQTGLRGLSLVTQLERKEEMSAYPSDIERFVQRTTSMKDWPVFNDFQRVSSRRGAEPEYSFRMRQHSPIPPVRSQLIKLSKVFGHAATPSPRSRLKKSLKAGLPGSQKRQEWYAL